MNIFFLHLDPTTCARLYLNKHCVKIILECAQMLYTAMWKNHSTEEWVQQHLSDLELNPYKCTHFNHPTAKWVRLTSDNFNYTIQLALELCYEYTRRYGKIHKCQQRIEWMRDHPPSLYPVLDMPRHCATKNIPQRCTPIPLAMPKEYHTDDVLHSYRLYYVREKFKLRGPKDTLDFSSVCHEWGISL